MSTVDGLGGAFIFSNDAGRLAGWYQDCLGFAFEGSASSGVFHQVFVAADPANPSRKLDTTFAVLQAKVRLPERAPGPEPGDMYGDQPFMVNLRVTDIETTLAELSTKGILPIKRQDEDYGRFAWIRDADGNRVELYQPREAAR